MECIANAIARQANPVAILACAAAGAVSCVRPTCVTTCGYFGTMESTKKRPHQALSLEKKLEILKELDRSGLTKTEVAKKFNIPKSTLSRILKNKYTIEGAVKNGTFTSKRMRMRTTPYEELEKVLFVWFKRARSSNFPISGPILEQKAREIALQMGVENFALSDGWLSRFKKRHGLVFKAISGESAAVNRDICTDWKQGRLKEILVNYEPRDVFSVDEMGLFYKVLPSKTLAFKGEACSGGKHSKDRITVLVGANMAGDEKLKLLVIGKSKHPRCFKGVRHLPVTYNANGRAWMTMAIFENWLREEDARFTRQGRKVVLIVDNCPAHGQVEGLKSISLEFLPANVTAVIQPMDQGVIQNIKVHYRRQLLHRMLLCADTEKCYNVDLLAAIHILAHAWEQVQATTIQRCFHHAGFQALEPVPHEEESPADADADAVFNQAVPSAPFTRQDYETIDESVQTCREETLEELIAEVQAADQPSSSDECDDIITSAVVPPDSAAKEAVELLQHYFEHEGCPEFLSSLSGMGAYFVKKQLKHAKQTTLPSFFSLTHPDK